ncbi:MAG: SPASM domain-containing protein, partial [Candidatus Omnitrophota bacterium]
MKQKCVTRKYTAGRFPQRIEIELASACNLRCTYCPRKYVEQLSGFMDPALFRQIIDEAACFPQAILVLHRRGESLLHTHFAEMVRYIKGKFRDIQLATNATVLDESKSKAIIEAVTFISFSIDIPEVFNRTRIPARYGDVEANIFRFLKLNKGKVQTQVSMVKTPKTPDKNVEMFKKLWKRKVDRIRIYEAHSLDGQFGSLCRKRSKRLPCVMPFYEVLIYCDGKVGRCNHDWAGFPMGDINASTIKEVWNNSAYKDLRTQQKVLKIKDEVCKNCSCWYPAIGEQGTGE